MKRFTKGLVSIIMPAYNVEQYIAQSIQSVLEQSYKNWELIVVEDCSTDGTLNIVAQYEQSNIIVLKNQSNSGPGFNCQKAIDYASGEFITRLDADDIFTPYRLEEQVQFLNKNKDYILVCGNAEYIDSLGNSLGIRKSIYDNENLQWRLLFKNPIISSTVMFRAQVAHNHNLQFTNQYLSEDYQYWAKLLQYGKGAMLENIWVKYRINPNGLSQQNKAKMIQNTSAISYELVSKILFMSHTEHQNLLEWYHNFDKKRDENFALYKKLLKQQALQYGYGKGLKFYIANLLLRNRFQKILYRLTK